MRGKQYRPDIIYGCVRTADGQLPNLLVLIIVSETCVGFNEPPLSHDGIQLTQELCPMRVEQVKVCH